MSTFSQVSAEVSREVASQPDATEQNASHSSLPDISDRRTSSGVPISEWNPGRLEPVPLPETTLEECLEIDRRIRQLEEEQSQDLDRSR